MNWPTTILGVALAGAAGYFAEPTLRPSLTGEKPVPKKRVVKSETPPAPTDPLSDPAPAPAAEPKVDPMPEPVTPPATATEPKADPVTPPPAEPAPEPKTDPVTPPPAEPAPAPVEPKMEEPKQEPAKEEPKEQPKEEPKPVDSSLKLDDEQIVKAMKRSFESGTYKELAAGKPIAWKAGAPETISGESYQTGILEYSGETIFGVRPIQAKALLKDGVVVKWISPKSGMEIK